MTEQQQSSPMQVGQRVRIAGVDSVSIDVVGTVGTITEVYNPWPERPARYWLRPDGDLGHDGPITMGPYKGYELEVIDHA
jgi:hypothetical protein